jgi:hypothetical protein
MMIFEESESDKHPEHGQCLICGIIIDPKLIIFEQRLIKDEDFCGKCFAEIMKEESMEYLENPGFLSLA